ncbi:peroxisome assembly factor 2 isoform X2 [Chelonus insularis]|nr:peroxisome assembly factor 2-like isoform X2 [Chelonus insularis]
MGFNFYNIDCSEIQTVSPSQTEAKLRLAFNQAEQSVPCILKLSNIQIFGKNAEGKIDERITSSFSEQLNDLYKTKMTLPLIIIATLEGTDIPLDIKRNFIEEIQIDHLTQNERIELLDWFLKVNGIKYQADLSKIASMCSGYTFYNIENLTLQAITNYHKRILTEGELNINDDDFLKAHNDLRSIFSSQIGAPKCPEVYWKDIGGLANLKHEIIRRIEIPLIHGFGVQSGGILFYGPPGTGKTLLAKAVATECKLNFLAVKGPELLNMYVGQSEKNVRDLFERARAASPCIIFFDELDALAPNRGRSGDSGGVMDRVVSQLLAEMDGLGSSAKTFIIGATNRPDLIDPALLRPGRFDKLLYIGVYSDPDSQLSVLQAITRKFHLADNVKLDDIVNKLPSNLTGADLQSLCSNAWLNAARNVIETYEKSLKSVDPQKKLENVNQKPKGPIKVCLNNFLEALHTLVPSISKEELNRYEQLHQQLTLKK